MNPDWTNCVEPGRAIGKPSKLIDSSIRLALKSLADKICAE
jgi:hypothetical protein